MPTTTRALISSRRTRALDGEIQGGEKKTNCSRSFTEQRLYLAICCWAKVNEETRPKYQAQGRREQKTSPQQQKKKREYVQFFQQSQRVEDAGRQLCQVISSDVSASQQGIKSKEKKKTSSQDWLNLTPHCPPPLESFDCDSFGWKVARANQKKKTTAQDAAE